MPSPSIFITNDKLRTQLDEYMELSIGLSSDLRRVQYSLSVERVARKKAESKLSSASAEILSLKDQFAKVLEAMLKLSERDGKAIEKWEVENGVLRNRVKVLEGEVAVYEGLNRENAQSECGGANEDADEEAAEEGAEEAERQGGESAGEEVKLERGNELA